jgi:hypothetical protein
MLKGAATAPFAVLVGNAAHGSATKRSIAKK